MTDDKWQTAKLAIGRFATPETGEQWGVNAELLAGKLIIGNNMILEIRRWMRKVCRLARCSSRWIRPACG